MIIYKCRQVNYEEESKMAILRRDGKAVNLSRGLYRGNVKDFNYEDSKLKKVMFLNVET